LERKAEMGWMGLRGSGGAARAARQVGCDERGDQRFGDMLEVQNKNQEDRKEGFGAGGCIADVTRW
jgi:hypothetical protein